MRQSQFAVSENGLLAEVAAREQATWYSARAPGVDPLDFEAHLMLVRAYDALKTDTPFERKGGLTNARYNLLRLLHGAEDGRALMTDIVQSMNVSPTNITKLVDGLEKDRYVRRAHNPHDKRKVWVELLPAGADVVERSLPDVVKHVTGLWQGMTHEEKRVLVHLLSKLRLDILTREAGARIEGLSAPDPLRASA